MKDQAIYLCSPKRTAIGSLAGALSDVPVTELGANVLAASISATKLPAQKIEEVILGCILTSGTGQAPARQAAIKAGLPNSVQALTINKVCSSGLKAVMMAATNIQAGLTNCALAGGMENMTHSPYLLPSMRQGARLGNTEALDSMIFDALWDPYNNFHMGNCAELCAKEFKFSREAQDTFALESYRRAQQAITAGIFKDEITPVVIKNKKGNVTFEIDEEPGKLKADKVSELRPAFQKDGTVTAANASSINDGAAAMVVCSEKFLKEYNLTPIARIVAQSWYAQAPEWFTTAPIGAIESVLAKAGKKVADIDLFEVNEAFSAVALAVASKLNIDQKKLNIYGGAVALGHPVGASGARILTTLCYALKRNNLNLGVAAICNGGGEATSILIERA
jgi:acetyl-CoA C-acetyltransferase